jgi:hypothetical protein
MRVKVNMFLESQVPNRIVPFEEVVLWVYNCPKLEMLGVKDLFDGSVKNLAEASALEQPRKDDDSWPRNVELALYDPHYFEDEEEHISELWAMCAPWVSKLSQFTTSFSPPEHCPLKALSGTHGVLHSITHLNLYGWESQYAPDTLSRLSIVFPQLQQLRCPWNELMSRNVPWAYLATLELTVFHPYGVDLFTNVKALSLHQLNQEIARDKFPSLASLKLYGPREEWILEVAASYDAAISEDDLWGYSAIEPAVRSTTLVEECRKRGIQLSVQERDTRENREWTGDWFAKTDGAAV